MQGESDERCNRFDDSSRDIECDVAQPTLPTSLKFNRNTMSIFVRERTTCKTDDRLARGLESTNDQSDFAVDTENIIYSPNFSPIAPDASHGHATEPDLSANLITASDFGKASHFNVRDLEENYTKMYQSIDDELKAREKQSDRLMDLLPYEDPLRSAVVLRSPRGNQPRTYTTDALYSALMDVKSGESIYR